MNRILLIDGNSLVYRAFYGSAYGPAGILTNSKGTPVNAITIFNRMISKAVVNYQPTHVFVAFDSGKKTKRHEKLESYKGGRSATPQELIVQFPLVKEMLDKMGIKRYEIPFVEADDIIGTLARRFSILNEVYVLSSDKDLYQLVDNNITIVVPQNGNKKDKIMEIEEFYMRMGYYPRQVIDMKGLVGDSSDNLPGVKGIGEKGAIKLLTKYDDLEGVYAHLEEHSDSVKTKLLESKDMAFLCKDLATLDCDVPIPFELDDIKFNEKSSDELISFFKELEINSMVKKYENMQKSEKDSDSGSQMSLDNILL